MADDFEKAVLFSFDQTGSIDAALKVCKRRGATLVAANSHSKSGLEIQERAVAYCNEAKAQPLSWQLCLEKYSTTAYLEVRFWCLQSLHEVCKCYGYLPPN